MRADAGAGTERAKTAGPPHRPPTARALVALVDGICLQALLTGGVYEEYAREVLARILVPAEGAPP
nr:hypothetical protein [Streptomyces sp. SP18CS02]